MAAMLTPDTEKEQEDSDAAGDGARASGSDLRAPSLNLRVWLILKGTSSTPCSSLMLSSQT